MDLLVDVDAAVDAAVDVAVDVAVDCSECSVLLRSVSCVPGRICG